MARVREQTDGTWVAELEGKDTERCTLPTRAEAVDWVVRTAPFVMGPSANLTAEDVPVYVLRERLVQVYERAD